ncbi:DUF4136 domain-containing protein [Silanimonas sp.]|jgi:hypothetical protein|uniref:DUF4136 domain-containing protein n=1 Tax=Silanimonas sp. TaxID=1929290 RepID=UPI0022C8A43A|nr:DUF4136 domain-containing protein [Silanimonas sp.]MCZ8062630.1 DUF4136 domain-containing protein [Silanimonas sp.]
MRLRPSIFVSSLLAAFVAVALPGCASTPIATAEQAPGADVRTYATFAFFEPLAMERDGYGTMAGERARAVLRREMESRGYRLDPENPALRINVIAAARDGDGGPAFSLGLGVGVGGGNTRGGLGVGIPLGGSGSRERSRLPGAIAIDVVDTGAKRVVWTGGVDVPRVGRDGEAEAFEVALRRVMAALPSRSSTP